MTLHDGLRAILSLGAPVATVAVGVTALMWTTGGSMPTVAQFAVFVGLMVAILLAAGTIIPRIGGDSA